MEFTARYICTDFFHPITSDEISILGDASLREETSELQVSCRLQRGVIRLHEQLKEKYFDYFVFNIVDCGVNYGLPRLGARHQLAPECGSS
jgi:hypothetical protein